MDNIYDYDLLDRLYNELTSNTEFFSINKPTTTPDYSRYVTPVYPTTADGEMVKSPRRIVRTNKSLRIGA